MNKKVDWIALSYNIPNEPSKNRVYIWRKLKDCGAEYLKQGVAVLPNSMKNLDYFKKLSEIINNMNGDSLLFELNFIEEKDSFNMIEKFKSQTHNEYKELIDDCSNMIKSAQKQQDLKITLTSEIKKLDKKYKRAKARQFFDDELSGDFEEGYNMIKTELKSSANDFSNQLRDFFKNK